MQTQSKQVEARFYLLSGHVQGVGFRPFVFRLAMECGLTGWVENWTGQVAIHVEGPREKIESFQHQLIHNAPPHSSPLIAQCKAVSTVHYKKFAIHPSDAGRQSNIRITPDLPVCDDCLTELFDSRDRRYRYPFINCTRCGPRYTIIEQLPYDRSNTTMKLFTLCNACRHEYINPHDRRFHAEPIACPDCGPALVFYARRSVNTFDKQSQDSAQALELCLKTLSAGKVVAVKGIGGFHLMCDAKNDDAVKRLRASKPRPHKPLAVMMLKHDLQHHVKLSAEETELLHSAVHPIVLADKNPSSSLSPLIAPELKQIGVMLPYSPLHHLLLHDFGKPLVATSANISGEPLLTQLRDVTHRLLHVADAVLDHQRPIQRPADDPVYQVIENVPRPLRLGRSNAPLEINLPFQLSVPTLAVGGHMKNTIALAWDNIMVVSPHIGDLDSARSQLVFEQVIDDLQQLYQVRAAQVVCDAHPDYASSFWARQYGLPTQHIFHHHAHAAAVAGEYPQESRWLTFTWDGTGMGTDRSIWGGEALLGHAGDWHRVASLMPFHLPGGDRAAREPWRSAAAIYWETNAYSTRLERNLSNIKNLELAYQSWQRNINSPTTSSMGRLFDAAACLIGLLTHASYEGQGPMQLEALAESEMDNCSADPDIMQLPLIKNTQGVWQTDWTALVPYLLDDAISPQQRACQFHHAIADTLVQTAVLMRDAHGDFAVGLCGGVFQNKLLTELSTRQLREHGFRYYIPSMVPVNDGGLCYGQIIEYAAQLDLVPTIS